MEARLDYIASPLAMKFVKYIELFKKCPGH
jgi:hypothetical protein